MQRLSIRMRLELMVQLLDCFLAGVIMLLDGLAQPLDPEVNFSATTFVVRSTAHKFLCACWNGQVVIIQARR